MCARRRRSGTSKIVGACVVLTPPRRGAYSGAVIPSRLQWILVVAALSLFVGLGISSLRLDSATFDEGKHLPVGYAFLKLGDYRFDPDNPPLGRMLAATPLLFMDVRVDREDRTYRQAQVWGFGHRFLYEWNDAGRLVMWGRGRWWCWGRFWPASSSSGRAPSRVCRRPPRDRKSTRLNSSH